MGMRYGLMLGLIAVGAWYLAGHLLGGGSWIGWLPFYGMVSFGTYSFLYLTKAAGLPEGRLRSAPAASLAVSILGSGFVMFGWVVMVLSRMVSTESPFDEMAPGLFLGGLPLPWHRGRYEQAGVQAAVNLCFEYPAPKGYPAGLEVHKILTLDGTAPDPNRFASAVDWAAARHGEGRGLLIHCAQGHGRSATLMAAVLLRLGLHADIDAAEEAMRAARPGVRLNRSQRSLVEDWAADQKCQGNGE